MSEGTSFCPRFHYSVTWPCIHALWWFNRKNSALLKEEEFLLLIWHLFMETITVLFSLFGLIFGILISNNYLPPSQIITPDKSTFRKTPDLTFFYMITITSLVKDKSDWFPFQFHVVTWNCKSDLLDLLHEVVWNHLLLARCWNVGKNTVWIVFPIFNSVNLYYIMYSYEYKLLYLIIFQVCCILYIYNLYVFIFTFSFCKNEITITVAFIFKLII